MRSEGTGAEEETAPWRAAPSGPGWGLRALVTLCRVLPLRLGYVAALPVTITMFNHWNRPRLAVVQAQRRMGQRLPTLAAFSVYLQYAACLVDRTYWTLGRLTPTVTLDPRMDTERVARIHALLAGTEPIVVLGSHCGMLELAAPQIETRGRGVRPVALPDGGAGSLLAYVGDASSSVPTARPTIIADGTPQAGLQMLSAIRQGQLLCLKADRRIPGSGPGDVYSIDLFGEAAEFPRGPAAIVVAGKARALAVEVFRVGAGRYHLWLEEIATDGGTEAITRRWVAHLERRLRTRPNQWFNFYGFWPGDADLPEGYPEVLPQSVRSLLGVVPGSIVAAVAAVGLLPGPTGVQLVQAAGLGLGIGVLVLLAGTALGADKQPRGPRNKAAQLARLLGPILACSLALWAVGPASTAGAALAIFTGIGATWIADRVVPAP